MKFFDIKNSVCKFKILLLISMIATVSNLKAESVVIIKSSYQSEPYQQAITGFQTRISHKYPEIKFIHSDISDTKTTIPTNGVIFALGSKALDESLKISDNQPLVATLIINNKILKKIPNTTAVLLKHSVNTQLKWHRRILPDVKRIGVLYNPNHNQKWVDEAKQIASQLGLNIVAIPVKSAKEIPSALKLLGRKADSLLGINDKTIYSSKTAKAILLYSYRNRIPFVGLSNAWVKSGAIYALDWDYTEIGKQSAEIVLRILAGESADAIELQLPEKQRYVLNLKTVNQMKLELTEELINGAFKVYE